MDRQQGVRDWLLGQEEEQKARERAEQAMWEEVKRAAEEAKREMDERIQEEEREKEKE